MLSGVVWLLAKTRGKVEVSRGETDFKRYLIRIIVCPPMESLLFHGVHSIVIVHFNTDLFIFP